MALAPGAVAPPGVTLVDDGNGTATLAGTSSVVSGTYTFGLVATNAVGDTGESFTLVVNSPAPVISVKFEGAVNYANSGSLTTGTYSVPSAGGQVSSVTGSGTFLGSNGDNRRR